MILSRRWAIFSISAMLFFLSQFYRSSIAVITPELTRDLNLGPEGLSLLSAVFFYSFALTQVPIGVFLDKAGARLTMTALSAVGVIGALAFALAESLGVAAAGRLLLGVGMACNFMGSLKLITMWFSPKWFATLSAILVSVGMSGNLLSSTPLVLMTRWVGWRHSFAIFAVFTFALTTVFFLVARDRPPTSESPAYLARPPVRKDPKAPSRFDLLFKMKDYWIISLGTFCRYGIFAAVQALWAGPYLMAALGFDAVAAGNIILCLNIGAILGGPFFGVMSDRLFQSRKGTVIAGFAGMASMLVILGHVPPGADFAVLATLFFLFGFFAGAGGVMYAHIKERLPVEMAGAAMTGINFFTMTGAAFFLQGIGGFMSMLFPSDALGAESFRWTFAALAFVLCLAGAVYAATRETLVPPGFPKDGK